MPIPSLPPSTPDPKRELGLTKARRAYAYDFSYEEMCFIADLPKRENFSPPYLAAAGKIAVDSAVNRGASKVSDWTPQVASEAVDDIARIFATEKRGDGWFSKVDDLLHRSSHTSSDATPDISEWQDMFATLPKPLALSCWDDLWSFGWQRLAGPVPVSLTRLDQLPPWLPVTDEHLRARTGDEGLTLKQALADGRLFVSDYELFANARAGETDGMAKYIWAPVALFCATPEIRGGLAPIAIQTAGHDGRADTLVTPEDGQRWRLARTAVQTMDETLQGAVVHVGCCHMVIQRFILAMHRQLAAQHPVHILLSPHFANTLAVNKVTRDSVVSPGGSQDRLLGPRLEDQLAAWRTTLAELDYDSLDPRIEFARRGCDDTSVLPDYPFRDDGLLCWEPLHAFVDGYIRLYYTSDADVQADGELAAFVREVGAPDGGRAPKLVAGVSLETIDDVVTLVTRILFRATVFHAGINDASYDWVAFAPNMPASAYSPLPSPDDAVPDDALQRMLPNMDISFEILDQNYQVASLKLASLGQYPSGHFIDPRVRPLVHRFSAALEDVDRIIDERNATRPLPYTYLKPSIITASINA